MSFDNAERQEMFRRNRKAMRAGFYRPLPAPITVDWRGRSCVITSCSTDNRWYCGTHTSKLKGREYIARVVLTALEVEQLELFSGPPS